jgi:hypothetical protein
VISVRRIELTRELYGAETSGGEGLPQTPEFIFNESIIETGVMCDKDCSVQQLINFTSYRAERGSILHVPCGDSGDLFYLEWDGTIGVDERTELPLHLPLLNSEDRNLDDAAIRGAGARGFNINDCEGLVHESRICSGDSRRNSSHLEWLPREEKRLFDNGSK